ncbi:hypothetical protein Daus18300_001444 [Diaporthe australafricana]|uniref:Uncharacterized protein n=1 Tax=Diaporthe australafricana TaxID=127596 RepID=A0ABR3XVQ0_9PEZI
MDRQHLNNSEDVETNTSIRTASIETLDGPHREAVRVAMSNILSTEIAETTYAQIIDGLPLIEVLRDGDGDLLCDDHPISAHTELRAGVLETTRRLLTGFDLGTLRFDSTLLNVFQGASPGSRAFKTRLIEILARSVHQVAVILYNNNPDLSSSTPSSIKDVHLWEPPKDASDPDGRWELWWQFNPHGPPATLFRHSWYTNAENYPEGAADMTGYWAESRILGGVVLFNRAAQGRGEETDAVYLHPERDGVTYRICLLTDMQKKAMLDFCLQIKEEARDAVACPLPVLPDQRHTQRVDPEEPIRVTGVCRDAWERVTPPPEWMGDGRAHCMRNPLDFLTKADHQEASSRWSTRMERW